MVDSQGYGLYMMEDERFRPDGKLITTGLGTYKVPRIRNIPQKLNVHLLKGRDTPNVVYSSKVGVHPEYLYHYQVLLYGRVHSIELLSVD